MKRAFSILAAVLLVAVVSCKKDNGVNGKTPKPKAVDIGLVVDGKPVLLASCNLGASKEYEYGDYFAWGEINPKSEYTWETYLYANGESNKLTKYCQKAKQDSYWDISEKPNGADDLTALLPEDDAAHKRLGGKWRMPTESDFYALNALIKDASKYKVEDWVAAVDENGDAIKDQFNHPIYGLRITQIETGNSVFFPAAGYCEETTISYVGSYGRYWSTRLSAYYPNFAMDWMFSSDGIGFGGTGLGRSKGFSIRPVMDK